MRRQQQNTDELERSEQQHRRALSIHQMCLKSVCSAVLASLSDQHLRFNVPKTVEPWVFNQSVSQSVASGRFRPKTQLPFALNLSRFFYLLFSNSPSFSLTICVSVRRQFITKGHRSLSYKGMCEYRSPTFR